MILTVTLNPSMDSIYFTDTFSIGQMNRCANPLKAVGGKGINASRTAAILGSEVQAIGALAGENGARIRAHLAEEAFDSFFLTIPGESRNAVTIMDHEKNQTEIVELGPEIPANVAANILAKILAISVSRNKKPIIALCGSANTKNEQLYQEYLTKIKTALGATTKVLTDISGVQLKNTLAGTAKPYFIKPNIQEFSDLIGQPVHTKQEILQQLTHPLLEGIAFVLVTCGSLGAIARVNNQLFNITVPKINVINPTGSGDATVGGIAYGLDHNYSIEETLRYGMACGISNALEKKVGFITNTAVATFRKRITITRI